jgi:hypothetical protein
MVMSEKDRQAMIDCLSASLKLLIKLNILSEEEVKKSLDDRKFEDLFDLLNEKYKDITK